MCLNIIYQLSFHPVTALIPEPTFDISLSMEKTVQKLLNTERKFAKCSFLKISVTCINYRSLETHSPLFKISHLLFMLHFSN